MNETFNRRGSTGAAWSRMSGHKKGASHCPFSVRRSGGGGDAKSSAERYFASAGVKVSATPFMQ